MAVNLKAYIADKIFTGESWISHHAIITEDGMIREIVPAQSLSSALLIHQFDQCIIAPSLIDLQIYGAYGKLLAVYPEADSLFKLTDYCTKGGTSFCLPTVATNTKEVFYKCIDAVRDYWNKGGTGVLGLHIEGPWINPDKRGAHIASLIHTPTINEVEDLLEYGKGVIRMITLAPEICNKAIIDLILSYDIVISAGHSNATYDEAMTGFANGITAVTHLYNAMSPFLHRQPGLVGAAMDDEKVMASIIPDGYHADYAAIRIAKQVMKERLFVITDAVTNTDKGYYHHQLKGEKYEAGGILSGSALTMTKALQNLVNYANIETGEALRMCSLYPAILMKLDQKLGKIEKGYCAEMVVLSNELDFVSLIKA